MAVVDSTFYLMNEMHSNVILHVCKAILSETSWIILDEEKKLML